MSMYYSELALDHAENPRNVGTIPDADGAGAEMNPVCGDLLTLFIKVQDNRVADAKYKVQGCLGAVAASSILTELLIGSSLEEAERLDHQSVLDALGGLPASKLHSAALAAGVLKKALADYRSKRNAP